jgi:hypothetical protein
MKPWCVTKHRDYNFETTVSNTLETPSSNLGSTCLSTHPNEQWLYLKVAPNGGGKLDIDTATEQDTNFAIWGPYEDVDRCVSCSRQIPAVSLWAICTAQVSDRGRINASLSL